jgi:tetratricopeptide (TPR) repeat protein
MGISIASTMWINRPEDAPAILSRALQFLNRAIELRPDSVYAHTLHATANYASLDWRESEQHYQEALAISRDGGTLSNYGNMLMRAGRSEAAIRTYIEAADAERYPSAGSGLSQNAYLAMERYSETSKYVAQLPVGSLLGFLLALNQGDAQALEAELRAWPKSSFQFTELFSPLLEVLDSPGEALALLRSVHANTDIVWPSKYHDIALLAAYYGDPEFALSVFAVEARLTTVRYGALWYPVMSEVRQLPAFQDLMRDVNLLEYWQAHGWSTHCRSLGGQDFECF